MRKKAQKDVEDVTAVLERFDAMTGDIVLYL